MRQFENEFWEMLRSGASPSEAGFTPERVQAYILATAEYDAMSVRAEELLRHFPESWWAPAIDEVLYGERVPGAWRGVGRYVDALIEVSPGRFVAAPRDLIARIGSLNRQALRLFFDEREVVVPALRAAANDVDDPLRWKCAAYLLSLDRSAETDLQRAITEGGESAAEQAEWQLVYVGYDTEGGILRRLFPEAVIASALRLAT